jgi:CheY-like chemotaxis protein
MAVLKVLVIDDEPGIRSGVSRILNNFHVTYPFMDEDYTFEVTEAGTGEEGIAMLERDMPDILLLDNKLPGIQGIDQEKKLRYRRCNDHILCFTGCCNQSYPRWGN